MDLAALEQRLVPLQRAGLGAAAEHSPTTHFDFIRAAESLAGVATEFEPMTVGELAYELYGGYDYWDNAVAGQSPGPAHEPSSGLGDFSRMLACRAGRQRHGDGVIDHRFAAFAR